MGDEDFEGSEYNVIINENDSIVVDNQYDEKEFDPEEDGPLPVPPLGSENFQTMVKVKKVSYENWEEGCNAKFKAYTALKNEKDKMFEENKVFKKFRGIFRGLKRCHKRAT